ncbi:MAG TPA: cbb3-type cytochrome c oxidase subunit I [Verrucomicrobiae bacterium]|jgi:cytochrome c oxidase cbb3-type subunit 1
MTVSSNPSAPQEVSSATISAQAFATPLEIDGSCRQSLLLLLVSAAFWLALGSVLGLLATLQLNFPQMLAGYSVMTYGHLRPAAEHAVLYGFASQGAYGIMVWMMCRLGRVTLCCEYPLIVAGIFWNVGVIIGFCCILGGLNTGFTWLEFPRYAVPFLFLAQLLIGISVIYTFYFRNERNVYPSQWYLLGAAFWFPWIYSAANLLLLLWPVRGVFQAVVNAWFINNFLYLWLGSVALASIYYFIPKLMERPLANRNAAAFSFWIYAFVTTFSGLTQLIGGPVPAWMVSLGIAANLLLAVPLLGMVINWWQTMRGGNCERARKNITFPFTFFAAIAFLLAGVLQIVFATRAGGTLAQFTYARAGLEVLFIYGFVGLALIGAIYYVLPRVANLNWPSAGMVKLHLGATVAGTSIAAVSLLIAGLVQGGQINSAAVPFHEIVSATSIWVGLANLGGLLIAVGQVAFFLNVFKLAFQYSHPFRKTAFNFVTGAPANRVEVRP